MQQVMESLVVDPDPVDAGDSILLEDSVEWIREPTAAERRELKRVQRMISGNR